MRMLRTLHPRTDPGFLQIVVPCPPTKHPPVRVFFCWQTDSPPETNRDAIRAALGTAKAFIERQRPGTEVILDEATRDTPGSPDIPSTILRKIAEADIVVADITTINRKNKSDNDRPCPNPNVLYELGYAVAHRGWHRIITMFNTAHGSFPNDLPFDISKQRVSPYCLTSRPDPDTKPIRMDEWIMAILDSRLDQLDRRTVHDASAVTRRERDLRTLRRLLLTLHVPTLEYFLDHLPRRIDDTIFWYWESFLGCVQTGLFYLYDPQLRETVGELLSCWERTLSHHEQYQSTLHEHAYVFGNPGDLPLPPERQTIWDEIDKARHGAARALASLLERVRADYLDIDLDEMSEEARRQYIDFVNDAQNP